MLRKTVSAAILAAFVMGVTAPAVQAHSGSNRTVDQYEGSSWFHSLYITLFGS
jgi:hypothetical protein